MASLLPTIESLAAYTPGLSIAEIQDRYGLTEVIKLASNENPLGASPLAQEAIIRNAQAAFRYPQGGNPRLKKALAKKHNVPETRIAIGNGSDEIIDLLIRMTAGPGNNIVCFQPCFSIYPIQAQISGIEVRRQPIEADFSFNFDKLLSHVDQNTRLVFITTPDNPSGFCPEAASIEKLAKELAQKAPAALLVIDEAYIDFATNEKSLSLLAAGRIPENVAFLRTMSKSYGLAGARLGYAVLPEVLAAGFWKARLPFSVNILAEEAALAALDDATFREATLATVREGREYLKHELETLGCQVWPSQANFLLFQLPDKSNAKICFERLLTKGIIIRMLGSYGLPNHLRVSIGNQRENRLFLAALRDFLTGK